MSFIYSFLSLSLTKNCLVTMVKHVSGSLMVVLLDVQRVMVRPEAPASTPTRLISVVIKPRPQFVTRDWGQWTPEQSVGERRMCTTTVPGEHLAQLLCLMRVAWLEELKRRQWSYYRMAKFGGEKLNYVTLLLQARQAPPSGEILNYMLSC